MERAQTRFLLHLEPFNILTISPFDPQLQDDIIVEYDTRSMSPIGAPGS